MAKYARKRRARRRSTKRFRGGIRKKNRPLRSQRYAKIKVDQVLPLQGTGGIQAQAVGFAWMQKQAIISNVFGHDGGVRYNEVTKDYEQYAVTGMRL